MHPMRLFEISEADIGIQNPFSVEQLMLVGQFCRQLGYLQAGHRLLDLACGQGELLSRWAKQFGITGTGVDISQAFLDMARRRAEELGTASQLTFVQGDAAEFATKGHSFDAVSCIGATWIGGGTEGTIDLMRQALKDPGRGLLLVGDLFWKGMPNEEAATAMGMATKEVSTLSGLYDLFDQTGVQVLNMVLADQEGWDRYETYRWMKVHGWLQDHSDDPDADEVKTQIEDWKRSYLVHRGWFGWGIFLLQGK